MNGEFAVCMNLVWKLSFKTLPRKCQEIHPDMPTRTIGRHGGGEETSRQQARARMSRQSASCHRQADLPLSVSTLPRFLRGRERDGLVWRCVWLGQFVHGAQEGTREEGANQKKEKKEKTTSAGVDRFSIVPRGRLIQGSGCSAAASRNLGIVPCPFCP